MAADLGAGRPDPAAAAVTEPGRPHRDPHRGPDPGRHRPAGTGRGPARVHGDLPQQQPAADRQPAPTRHTARRPLEPRLQHAHRQGAGRQDGRTDRRRPHRGGLRRAGLDHRQPPAAGHPQRIHPGRRRRPRLHPDPRRRRHGALRPWRRDAVDGRPGGQPHPAQLLGRQAEPRHRHRVGTLAGFRLRRERPDCLRHGQHRRRDRLRLRCRRQPDLQHRSARRQPRLLLRRQLPDDRGHRPAAPAVAA